VVNFTLVTKSENYRPFAYPLALLLLSVVPMLRALEITASAKEGQPLEAIPELVDTRYCYGDAEVYSVWLKLRVKYVNRAQKTLILDREIGKAWCGEKVARNLADLAAGKYEYNPNIDWFFSSKDKLPHKPNSSSPDSGFVVLSPGATFEGKINASVVAQYESPKNVAGSITPGVHVLQLEISAWNHPGDASAFAESWRKVGDLVTGVVKTEPLEIRITSDPRVERTCK
jgi:hypothetical protein